MSVLSCIIVLNDTKTIGRNLNVDFNATFLKSGTKYKVLSNTF